MFVAFIDFKTAFDTVDRDILMNKLRNLGKGGKMNQMIRGIYEKTENEVITEEGISYRFATEKGVGQGCPLSPTLFNLFIEDIDNAIARKNEGGTVIGRTKIFLLKFADDIALVSDDEEGLQSMLGSLEKYVNKNRLIVNTDKTKIMVFGNGGRRGKKERWKFNGRELEPVNCFKYLGFHFSTRNEFGTHIRLMAGKSQKAINMAWGIMKRAKIDRLDKRLYLLDVPVKSGVLYGIEVWGWQRWKAVERVQSRYVKSLLGVNKNTPDYIWRLEAGRRSFATESIKRAGRYILRILKMKGTRWPRICLCEELRGINNGNPSKWGERLEQVLHEARDGATNAGLDKGRRRRSSNQREA